MRGDRPALVAYPIGITHVREKHHPSSGCGTFLPVLLVLAARSRQTRPGEPSVRTSFPRLRTPAVRGLPELPVTECTPGRDTVSKTGRWRPGNAIASRPRGMRQLPRDAPLHRSADAARGRFGSGAGVGPATSPARLRGGLDQHLALVGVVRRAHHALALHLLDHARGLLKSMLYAGLACRGAAEPAARADEIGPAMAAAAPGRQRLQVTSAWRRAI